MPALRTIETPLCPMIVGATDLGVCLLEMGSPERVDRERAELEDLLSEPFEHRDHAHIDHLEHELGAYFKGELTEFSVPLDTSGTDWQRKVWDHLRTIEYGRTTTYGDIATALDNPGGSRAVGLANGSNRVSILIPCHRVIASDGALHGYGGGLERKRFLIDHEALHSGNSLFASR